MMNTNRHIFKCCSNKYTSENYAPGFDLNSGNSCKRRAMIFNCHALFKDHWYKKMKISNIDFFSNFRGVTYDFNVVFLQLTLLSHVKLNWWKGKPSGSIACTRKQQNSKTLTLVQGLMKLILISAWEGLLKIRKFKDKTLQTKQTRSRVRAAINMQNKTWRTVNMECLRDF